MTKYDRWSREGMPEGDALRQIQRNIDATMRGIIADSRHGVSHNRSMIPERQQDPKPVNRGTNGWVDPAPLVPPRGLWAESPEEKQSRIARQQAAETEEVERRLDRGKPSKVRSEYDPFSAERMGFGDTTEPKPGQGSPPWHRDKDKP